MNDETREMEESLTRLQTVKPFDYQAAYYAAYQGIGVLDPRGRSGLASISAAMIYGRTLALNLWTQRQAATLELRASA